MKTFLATVSFVLLASIGTLQSQYLTPNSFDMGNATLGVPKYFNAVFKNVESVPVRMFGAACSGYADMDVAWTYKSDSARFDSSLVPAGASVDIVVRIVATSEGMLATNCSMAVFDETENVVGGQGYSMHGGVAAKPALSASASELQFETTERGSTSTRTVVISNTGTGDAHVYVKEKILTPFSISSHGPWVIKSKDSLSVDITFAPSASGDASTFIEFAQVYLPRQEAIRVQLRGTGGSSVPELTPAVPSIHVDAVQVDRGDTVDIRLTANADSPVVVVGISLSIAEVFTVLSPVTPLALLPSADLVVKVKCLPTAAGSFVDTLVVTTSKGSVIRIPINATAVVSSVAQFTSAALPHPNPSNGGIQWSGKPREQWRIVTSVGEEVERVVADEDGNCLCRIDMPGMYMLVSTQTGQSASVLVLR